MILTIEIDLPHEDTLTQSELEKEVLDGIVTCASIAHWQAHLDLKEDGHDKAAQFHANWADWLNHAKFNVEKTKFFKV